MGLNIYNYLSIGNACNLKCGFCYNDISKNKKQYFDSLENIVNNMNILKNKGEKEVLIVGGEPLFHPKIEEIIKLLKLKGFERIYIVTNGIRLSDYNFANTISSNITDLEFSINAYNKTLFHEISGNFMKGFEAQKAGIENILSIINKGKKIELYSNTVINKKNYIFIGEIIQYITSLGIKNINISFMYDSKGMTQGNKDLLVKYSEAIKQINKLSFESYNDINLKISWLPMCMHKHINNVMYNIRESSSLKGSPNNFAQKDEHKLNKTTLGECLKCRVYGIECNGVFKEYTNIFGEDEFKAIN